MRKNNELSPEELLKKAKNRALYLLGERMMCRAELVTKLTRTYGAEIAEKAAGYVCELGYVNDEEYAPRFAEYLIRRKHWGKRRARQEMLYRGLSKELTDNVLADIPDEDTDEELTALIERRYADKITDRDDRRRTIAALARRGYDFGAIKRCIDQLTDQRSQITDHR